MRGAASALLVALAGACTHANDLQPSLATVASRLRAEDAACTAPPRPTATEAVLCQEHTERKIFAESAPYLIYPADTFSAQRRNAARWLDQQNADASVAARRFDQTLTTTLKDLRAREPRLGDPLSPLSLRLLAAKPLDTCPDDGSAHERLQCVADLVAPIWQQEAPDSLDNFNTASKTILAAASELDTSKAPQIRQQNAQQYAAMLAQPTADLTRDIQAEIAVAQRRIDRASLRADASATPAAADAAAAIGAAIGNAALAAAPGRAATEATAPAAAPAQPPPRVTPSD
jgi:hypothetical protein